MDGFHWRHGRAGSLPDGERLLGILQTAITEDRQTLVELGANLLRHGSDQHSHGADGS